MSDAATLRQLLSRIDGSAPAIQKAAGAMMKHYDRSAAVAVTEWRNCLQTARKDQLLPLLYVANEVLQNSKRNRGNKFLEAFSPTLGQSLRHLCQMDPTIVEKVRRTVKIWGDRRVFSVRFVNALLQGLEPLRQQQQEEEEPVDEARFSPLQESQNSNQEEKMNNREEQDEEEDIMDILQENEEQDDDEQDDDNLFGSASQHLDIEIDMDSAALNKSASPARPAKRRRSSTATTGSQSSQTKRRRRSALSASNLLDMWNRLVSLQQSYEHAQLTLEKIDTTVAKTSAEELENLVGDELQFHYKQNMDFNNQITVQRQSLHDIAQERKMLEEEAMRYLPWLEKSLQQDEDDVQFCDTLEQKLLSFQKIHGHIRMARDILVAEERKRQEQEAERERKRKEEEENEKFRKAALAKETEAKPGMVWNPATREYMALNTDESWRDH